jgi:hypothetical protein
MKVIITRQCAITGAAQPKIERKLKRLSDAALLFMQMIASSIIAVEVHDVPKPRRKPRTLIKK